MSHTAERLLGGYVFGTLTDAERRELHAAALEDQGVFNALAEQAPLREALADRKVRVELLDLLAQPNAGNRVRAFFGRPARWIDLAAAAALLIALLLVGRSFVPRPLGEDRAASSATLLRALLELPPQQPIPAELRVAGHTATFRVDEKARALLLLVAPDGGAVELFPLPDGAPVVEAGVPVTVTIKGDVVRGASVRLIVFPADVDPGTLDRQTLRRIADRITVVDVRPEPIKKGAVR